LSTGGPPGGFGPRPCPFDDEKTPVVPHVKPTRVPTTPGMAPPPLPPRRVPTPPGATLAALGRRSTPAPELIISDPEDDQLELTPARVAVMKRLLRTCDALTLEDVRMLYAFALRLRPGVGG
jgi:hypothetical protein